MNSRIQPTFLEQPLTVASNMTSSPGWFAYVHPENGNIIWVSCRDTWQSVQSGYIRKTGMYMGVRYGVSPVGSVPIVGTAVDVATFLHKVEHHLKVRTYSKFQLTTSNYVMCIWLSPFWARDLMRRSLLTLLLRCALQYDADVDNFEEALYSTSYASDTKLAIRRFMRGYTYYHRRLRERGLNHLYGNIHADGWYSVFYAASDRTVRRLLQKTTQKKEKVDLKTAG